MKYFSKNPEEWKKQEQEFLKKEKEKTQRSRKRGIMLLLVNIAIVVIVFLGLKMYYSQFPSYGSSSRYQILIKTPDAYVSGTPLDVQVRLYNNNHQARIFTDFHKMNLLKPSLTLFQVDCFFVYSTR